MNATALAIPGVYLLTPTVLRDGRGCFYESFNRRTLERLTGYAPEFVQDNHSVSRKNVLRGLHYQTAPMQQAKLVRVIKGAIFDVVVDLRPASSCFGKWLSVILSGENLNQLWIPEGCAHGFLALTDEAEVMYKVNTFYSPEHERTLLWNDPVLDIAWPLSADPVISAKDAQGVPFDPAAFNGT